MAGLPLALQTKKLAAAARVLEAPELGNDPRFASNAERMHNLPALQEALAAFFKTRTSGRMASPIGGSGRSCGTGAGCRQMQADPQTLAREMVVETVHSTAGK